jgi:hypothetical protein
MTWQDLKSFVNSLNEENLKEEVLILPFCNGEMEIANLASFVGQTDFDYHCSDISQGFVKKDSAYIICGYSGENLNSSNDE